MKIINEDNSLVIKSWCNNPEDGAIAQAKNLAKLPFAFRQICLMPDTHQGYGMPIGGVLATKGVVIPNAVGVDIGCGMCAVKTSLTEISKEQLKVVFGGSKEYKGGIRSSIPVGFAKHSKKQVEDLMPNVENLPIDSIVLREWSNALHSLGTLGGGNHFLEIQKGSDGYIWIMIHSGSRNLGKQVADHYNKKAVELNEKWFSSVPKKWELAFLPIDAPTGREYLAEMQFCVEFALANRILMMTRAMETFNNVFQSSITFGSVINIAHNYARHEHHFGENVIIHRKGATSAKNGELGIIPGSQGSSSYIVRGKGEVDSFMSCSHGAGRKMGRKEAERTLDLAGEIKRLDDKDIIHAIRGVKDLDEATGAYKDIEVVMEEQKDLVEVLVKLEPLAVIKG